MRIHFRFYQIFIIGALLCFSCKNKKENNQVAQDADTTAVEKGLKDYYKGYFPVGVAVSPQSFQGPSKNLILREFNSLTPENVMKMGPIHPQPDQFNWEPADKIIAFAQEHGMKVRGHNLVWHQQTPDWIFKDENGQQVGREELLKRMKAHIDSVVGRYKGKIYAWDVVNEAIDDNPDNLLRDSKWREIIGDDFIQKAFEYAHEADPEAKLFYNDYNAVIPEKRDRIIKLLNKLIEDGAPIDGIGIQGHWSIYAPSEEDLNDALNAYVASGLDIQITELDVSLYKWEKDRRPMRPDESDEFTPELQNKQTQAYKMFFKTFRNFRDKITGVTFWNVADNYSWLDHYPVEGRKNYPLLFDENYKRKQVYDSVINFKN